MRQPTFTPRTTRNSHRAQSSRSRAVSPCPASSPGDRPGERRLHAPERPRIWRNPLHRSPSCSDGARQCVGGVGGAHASRAPRRLDQEGAAVRPGQRRLVPEPRVARVVRLLGRRRARAAAAPVPGEHEPGHARDARPRRVRGGRRRVRVVLRGRVAAGRRPRVGDAVRRLDLRPVDRRARPVRPRQRLRRRPRGDARRVFARERRALGAAAEGLRHDAVLARRRRPRGAALVGARVPRVGGDAPHGRADDARALARRFGHPLHAPRVVRRRAQFFRQPSAQFSL